MDPSRPLFGARDYFRNSQTQASRLPFRHAVSGYNQGKRVRRKAGVAERSREEEKEDEECPSHLTKGEYRGVGAGTKEVSSKFLPTLTPKTYPRMSLEA